MRHPHLGFLSALLVVGPFFAIAGMSASGVWQPLGVGAGAVVVAVASARSTMFSYRDRTIWSPIRWRMLTLTAMRTHDGPRRWQRLLWIPIVLVAALFFYLAMHLANCC